MPNPKPSQAVDCHAHVFSAEAPAVPGARYRPGYAAELEAWRALWRPAGITHGVVVQPSFFGADNREMLVTVASDLAHLRGVAVLNPHADLATLERFHADGVRAIRLNLKGVADYEPFAAPPWRALYERVHAVGWHVEIHVDTGRLPDVGGFFGDIPLTLVFDHFGNPGDSEHSMDATFAAVRSLASSREVWCKLSGASRLGGADPPGLTARWLDAVGPRRLVWGSDWPWTGFEAANDYPRLRAALDRWIDDRHLGAVLWDNAARLYQFD